MVTKTEIIAGLRQLGLSAGMGVMVHSSLSSFGYVQGGAHTVLEALMEVLTPEGTLLLPSFNHDAPFHDGGPGVYDPLRTPTANGAIPDAFWRMPGVLRSLNPTHPFAAWGKHSQRYIQFHHRTLTMGPQSPLGLLCADDGWGLLLGVDYGSNTFHHVVEMSTGAPCLGQRSEAYPVLLPDGHASPLGRRVLGRTWGWRDGICPITDQGLYALEMPRRGLQRTAHIGGATATFFRLQDCYAVIAELLQHGQGDVPPCNRCPVRPRRVAHTVESDWDAAAGQLKPDSEAWGY
jgi:aminoglycoside 3-N-acetyltransferase